MVITALSGKSTPDVSVASTTKVVLVVEYDGTRYNGFQLQGELPTIQRELEEAFRKLTGEERRVVAASRTDTGVHAWGQVVSFRTHSSHSIGTFIRGMNYYLPQDIAVKAAYRMRDSFHVQRHAVSREYRYFILNSGTRSPLRENYAWLVSGGLDTDAMNHACQALVGEHDLTSFSSGVGAELKNPVRHVYRAEVTREGEMVVFEIMANSFLRHQVRNTVGALVQVALGRMSSEEFRSLITLRKPGLAGPSAPACGLYLIRVNYARPFEEEIL